MEERLLAPRHVFQSLWTFQGPNGQLKSKGGIVNVPVEIDTSVKLLPRNINDSHIIHIQLARRMTYMKNYMSGVVRPKLLYDAAKAFVSKPLPKEQGIKFNKKWSCNSSLEPDYYFNEDDHFVQNAIYETLMTNDKEEAAFCGLLDHTLRIAPAEQYKTTSILFDDNCEFLAFPKVFGGYKINPEYEGTKLPYSDVAKSMALRYDRRVAERGDLLLFIAKKSPHVHLLLWIENAPLYDPSNKMSKKAVCNFVDQIISTYTNQVDNNLADLQFHRHTHTCYKKHNQKQCRFGIPFFPMRKTRILKPLSIKSSKRNKKISMQTRRVVQDYKKLAGVTTKSKMAEQHEIEEKQNTEEDQVIDISSTDENFQDFESILASIKKEPSSEDNESNAPLATRLSNPKSTPTKRKRKTKSERKSNLQDSSKNKQKEDKTKPEMKMRKQIKPKIKKYISSSSSDSDSSDESNKYGSNLKKKARPCDSPKPSTSRQLTETEKMLLTKSRTKNESSSTKILPKSESESDSDTSSSSESDDNKKRAHKKKYLKHKRQTSTSDSDESSTNDSDTDSSTSSNTNKKKISSKQRGSNSTKRNEVSSSDMTTEDTDTSCTSGEENMKKFKFHVQSSHLKRLPQLKIFFSNLNETTTKTSRNLRPGVPYKLLKLTVSKEIGFNGVPYKKAVAKFKHPKKDKTILINLPGTIAKYSKKTLKEMKRIDRGQHPNYTIKRITTKKKPVGKGTYDLVEFEWS
ncbi:Halomucin [Frankliniella fusca]|uniref:Halomucin n=1 Tax=Frankliniella fusca TaxID=407009 RepID=A0AAE1HNZ4_9NEOP|nr:Halomucin [Frankliniella fusca]